MSTDTSLSDLIFRSAEHPAALPDLIIHFFQSAGHSHWGWHCWDPSTVQGMVRNSEGTCPSPTCSNGKQSLPFCLIFPALKILKQNSMCKTTVKWNNRKTHLFNAVASSDWHLTQSIPAFRTDRQVTDKPTVITEKMTLEHNDALLF